MEVVGDSDLPNAIPMHRLIAVIGSCGLALSWGLFPVQPAANLKAFSRSQKRMFFD
jgi:hypothetical protein